MAYHVGRRLPDDFQSYYPWNMPELNWPFGYLLCLAVMASMAIGMLIDFKGKMWL
jgi:Mg2+ and Co2+ transporter CorA